jgi:hypothetical protein
MHLRKVKKKQKKNIKKSKKSAVEKLIFTANNSVNEVEIKFGGKCASGQIQTKEVEQVKDD